MKNNESFGSFLRKMRLKAGYGLRSFATAIDMQPSNLCNIEQNRLNPPRDKKILTQIAETLKLKKNSSEWQRLFDLSVKDKEAAIPPDIAAFVEETPGIPVLLRTIEGRNLSVKELKELTDYIAKRYEKR